MEKEDDNLMLLYFVGCWVLYAVIHIILKNGTSSWNGVLATTTIISLDVAGFVYSCRLWKVASEVSKRIFGFFVVSFFCITISDLIYQPLYGILKIPRNEVSIVTISIYNIAYIFCTFFRILAFGSIINLARKKTVNSFTVILPVVVITVMTAMFFVLASSFDYDSFSLDKFYDLIELILQSACFIIVLFCLGLAKNKGVFYLSLGYLLDVVANLVMNANLFSQLYNTTSFAETLWFLDSVLLVYGLIYLKQNNGYKDDSEWTHSYNSIKTQTAFWSLIFCIFATGICFFGVIANLDALDVSFVKIHQTIATIFIIFTFVFMVGSIIFSNILYRPFARLTALSKGFLTGGISVMSEKKSKHNILEFKEIEDSLQKSLTVMQERNKAMNTLTKITAVTKHDIRSPLTSLKMQLDLMAKEVPPNLQKQYQYIVLSCEAIFKILKEFWEQKENEDYKILAAEAKNTTNTYLEPIIDYLLESKKLLFPNISFDIVVKNQNLYVNVNPDHLKRILSNILNNSAEAIMRVKENANGKVEVVLTKEKDTVVISVCDNGCGMSQSLIKQIGAKEISTKQEQGHGIGLYSAVQYIKSWGGDYRITSNECSGTTVSVFLPAVNNPM